MPQPSDLKIYHIVHLDRLPSIICEGGFLCDAGVARHTAANPTHRMGTMIGINKIKRRRLTQLDLTSHPNLYVGQCVPFYICQRSIMLYVIHCANHREVAYLGGQEPIVHLEVDLLAAVHWADHNQCRWAFTLSNAGTTYFEDKADLDRIGDINWDAVNAKYWTNVKDCKQAEFLVERSFPWHLVTRIGVISHQSYGQVNNALFGANHKPLVDLKPDWYYYHPMRSRCSGRMA